MLRNLKQTKAKKPVMVMLHGSGSSAAIFGIQTRLLAKGLSKKFELVFLNASTPCAPGLGVLPLFADMPGYYRWIEEGNMSESARFEELQEVARYVNSQLGERGIKPGDVAAFLGFSQGALVSLAMLGLQIAGESEWENLRFAVAIGAGTSGNPAHMRGIENMIGTLSDKVGREDGKFPGYSVHASGVKDLSYKDGKQLANLCVRERTKTMDYREGHVVPRQWGEVMKLVQLINSIDEASRAPSLSTESTQAPAEEPVHSLLERGNLRCASTYMRSVAGCSS